MREGNLKYKKIPEKEWENNNQKTPTKTNKQKEKA